MSNLNKLMNLILEEPCVVITDSDTKMMILSELDFIADVTFKSVNEAEDDLLGYYEDICIYLIKHNLNLKYDRAKIVYDSLRIGDILNDEKTLNLRNSLRNYYHKGKSYNKRIILATKPSRLLEYALNKYEYIKVEYDVYNNIHANKYIDIISEVESLANKVAKVYKENNLTNFDDFIIYVGNSEYVGVIENVFSFYGIPTSYDMQESAYSAPKIKSIVDKLDIESPDLSSIKDDDLRNTFVKCYNKLVEINFTKDDLIDELSNCSIRKNTKGILIRGANSINPMFKYTFIVGFSFKNIPSIHKDDLFYNDDILESVNINTSFKENKKEKEYFINSLLRMEEVFISYSLNGITTKYVESDLLDGIVEFKEDNEYKFKYSISRAKLDYNKAFEKKMLTGEVSEYLKFYQNRFGRISKYDSSYNTVDSKMVSELVQKEGKINLSYSKLEKYYGCPFSYYCNYILDLKVYNNTADLGNVLHLYLQNYINDKSYTLDKAIEEFNNLTNGEKYILKEPYKTKYQNMMNMLISEIEDENEQYGLNLVGTEIETKVLLPSDQSIILSGKIDKVMEKDGKIIVIDYKSGSKIKIPTDPAIEEDNKTSDYYKKYQLFIYLIFEGVSYENFAGAFYQRIMPKNKEDLASLNEMKFFKPYGYKNAESTLPFGNGGNKKESGQITKEQFDKVMNDTTNLILNYKTNVLNARFDIKPLPGLCKFCNYKNICYYSFKEDGDLDE